MTCRGAAPHQGGSHLSVWPPLDAVLAAEPLDDCRRYAHHFADFFNGVLKIAFQVSQGHPLAKTSLGPFVSQPRDIILVPDLRLLVVYVPTPLGCGLHYCPLVARVNGTCRGAIRLRHRRTQYWRARHEKKQNLAHRTQ